MTRPCRRTACTGTAQFPWLSDWCNPACQFVDLDESGVDMRMKLRDEPGGRYDNLRYATAALDYELVEDHRLKFKTAEYVAAGGVAPEATPIAGAVATWQHNGRDYRADRVYVDEICPPAPKPLPRAVPVRPRLAGLIRRLWP